MSETVADNQRSRASAPSHAGAVAGSLSCVFGVLGILTIGIIFVPLAGVCAAIGLLRGLFGRSAVGFGLSIVGGFLTFVGALLSPTIWALFLTGMLVPAAITVATRPSHQEINEPSQQLTSEPSPAEAQAQKRVQELTQYDDAMYRVVSLITDYIPKSEAFSRSYQSTIAAFMADSDAISKIMKTPSLTRSDKKYQVNQVQNEFRRTYQLADKTSMDLQRMTEGGADDWNNARAFCKALGPQTNSEASTKLFQKVASECELLAELKAKLADVYNRRYSAITNISNEYQKQSSCQVVMITELNL